MEVGFASGSLAPGAATGEIQLRLNKADWSTFDESDDYSRSTSTGFTDHAKIGLYLGAALTWGTAPDPPPSREARHAPDGVPGLPPVRPRGQSRCRTQTFGSA
ncbi:hypothetical protein ACFQVA_25030 [Actinomadura keratinilytica]